MNLRKAKACTIFVRLIEVIFGLVIIPCVGAAELLCVSFTGYSGCSLVTILNIQNWGTLYDYSNAMVGLWFIFSMSCFFIAASFIMLFYTCVDWRHKIPELIVLIFAILCTLISAILMSWYAAGWGFLSGFFYYGPVAATGSIQTWVQTWVAAAVFLFLLFFVFIIDAILTFKYAAYFFIKQNVPVYTSDPNGHNNQAAPNNYVDSAGPIEMKDKSTQFA